MAQRYFQQFEKFLMKGLCTVYGNVSIGASGAPTLNNSSSPSVSNKSLGIASVVRNSTGNYTFSFGDPNNTSVLDNYQYLVDFDFTLIQSSVTAGVYNIQVWQDNASSGTVVIQVYGPTSSGNTTPAVQDIDNGAVLLVKFVLKQGIL